MQQKTVPCGWDQRCAFMFLYKLHFLPGFALWLKTFCVCVCVCAFCFYCILWSGADKNYDTLTKRRWERNELLINERKPSGTVAPLPPQLTVAITETGLENS